MTSFEQSDAHKIESQSCMLAALALINTHFEWPDCVLDLGCGPGHMVEIANQLGIQAIGLDLGIGKLIDNNVHCVDIATEESRDYIKYNFLSDLCLCLEVAEHIPAENAGQLVSNIISGTNKLLLFSAAIPGQGGCGHINERPHAYWKEKFELGRLTYLRDFTQKLRTVWTIVAPDAWWYGRNVMAFQKPSKEL